MVTNRTWVDFQLFWGQQFTLKKNTALVAAAQFSFGNVATKASNGVVLAQFNEFMDKFAATHSIMQTTIISLTSINCQIAALNQQLPHQLMQVQMMCQAMDQQPPVM